MNLLLDTHALLWWLDDQPTLSEKARAAIANPQNVVLISAVVIWEIRIKQALGKLKVPRNFRKVLDEQPFEMLDITADHAYKVGDLSSHHRDPFDRMLVAQAKAEGLTLITRDTHLKRYRISIIQA